MRAKMLIPKRGPIWEFARLFERVLVSGGVVRNYMMVAFYAVEAYIADPLSEAKAEYARTVCGDAASMMR